MKRLTKEYKNNLDGIRRKDADAARFDANGWNIVSESIVPGNAGGQCCGCGGGATSGHVIVTYEKNDGTGGKDGGSSTFAFMLGEFISNHPIITILILLFGLGYIVSLFQTPSVRDEKRTVSPNQGVVIEKPLAEVDLPPKSAKQVDKNVEAAKTGVVDRTSVGKEVGAVVITSVPAGAKVVFDGQGIPAPTPVTIRKVPQGRNHSFSVNLDGYASETRSFSLEEKEKTFNISLNRTAPVAGEQAKKTDKQFGEVVIMTNPPKAQVIFDGKRMPALTPLTVRKVPVGKEHTFSVNLDGYRSVKQSFNMDGDQKTFNIRLEPRK